MLDIRSARELNEAFWFDALAAMLEDRIRQGDGDPDTERAARLARLGQRVMALDAEDFFELATRFKSYSWAPDLAACGFPIEPRSRQRGALSTLVPLYQLMLEALDLRRDRNEPQGQVVVAYLIGEYLCQLAWEQRLGHAGDPALIAGNVGERWGTADPACPHPSAIRATARRALTATTGDIAGFTTYLNRFHSRLGDALAVCAMNHRTTRIGDRPEVGPTCPDPCRWAVQGRLADRVDLDARCRLALMYVDSPLVALRHYAPVGHFFGVPSQPEITDAWNLTWASLTEQWPDRGNPLSGRDTGREQEALPGLSMLVSTVAGRRIEAGSLLHRIRDDIDQHLDRVLEVPRR